MKGGQYCYAHSLRHPKGVLWWKSLRTHLGTIGGIAVALLLFVIGPSLKNQKAMLGWLTDIREELRTDTTFTTFPDLFAPLSEATTGSFSVLNVVGAKHRCPCGSGKTYGECHSPGRDNSDQNHWRGPGFAQSMFFGFTEKFNGIDFQSDERGEFVLLQGDNRIPLGKFFTMPVSITELKAIVSHLVVTQHSRDIVFAGTVDVAGDAGKDVQVLIGTSDLMIVSDFLANVGGRKATYERGQWLGYIGLTNNPMSAESAFKWYRYFAGRGFLVDFQPGRQLTFRMVAELRETNVFTISLPFGQIELAQPEIAVSSEFTAITLEVERENMYWDLILGPGLFEEESKAQKDSLLFSGLRQSRDTSIAGSGKRKVLEGPRKLRFTIARGDAITQ